MGAHESKDSSSTMGLLRKGQKSTSSTGADSSSSIPLKARSSETIPQEPAVVWPETSIRWQSLYDVYICHSVESSDTPYAIEMLSYLEEQPDTLRCFLPVRDMVAGSPLATEMCLGTQNSHCWVLLMTPDFIADSWCKYQMHQCLAQAPLADGRLIPVVLGLPFSQYPAEMRHMFAIRGKLHDKSVFRPVKKAIMSYLTKLVTETTDELPSASSSNNSQIKGPGTQEATRNSTNQDSASNRSTRNSTNLDSASNMSTRNSTNQDSTSDISTRNSNIQESTSDMSTRNSNIQESTRNSITQESTIDMSTRNSNIQDSTGEMSMRNSNIQDSTGDMSTRNSNIQDSTGEMSTRNSTTQHSTSDMSTNKSTTQESRSYTSTRNSNNQEPGNDLSMRNATSQEFTSDMSTQQSRTETSTDIYCGADLLTRSTSDMFTQESRTEDSNDIYCGADLLTRSTSDMSTQESRTETSTDIYCGADLLTRSTSDMSMQNSTTEEINSYRSMRNPRPQDSTNDMSTLDSSDIYCGTDLPIRCTREVTLNCSTHRISIDQSARTRETRQFTKDTNCQSDHISIKEQELGTDTGCSSVQLLNTDPHAHCNDIYTSQDLYLSYSNVYTNCRSVQVTNRDGHILHGCDGEEIQGYLQAHSNEINKTVTDSTAFLPEECKPGH